MLLAATSHVGTLGTALGFVILALLAAAAIALYFFPTVLVRTMDYPVRRRVFWLNLLIGWTVVGWVVVLRMAWRAENRALLDALGGDRTRRGRLGRRLPGPPEDPLRAVTRVASAEAATEEQAVRGGGNPPAGWYDDPLGDGERWWDGASWTEQVRPRGA